MIMVFAASVASAQLGGLGKVLKSKKEAAVPQATVNLSFIETIKGLDTVGLTKAINQIVEGTGKTYKFKDRYTDGREIAYTYANPDQTKEDLVFVVGFWNEGENLDLGRKGVKTFNIKSIYGVFLDLYPIWSANFSNKNTAEQITSGSIEFVSYTYKGVETSASFKKYKGLIWQLRF